MVEPGDNVSATLKKEFGEESLGSLELSPEKRAELEKNISLLFQGGEKVRNDKFVCALEFGQVRAI